MFYYNNIWMQKYVFYSVNSNIFSGCKINQKYLIDIYIKIVHGHFELKHPFLQVDIFLYDNIKCFYHSAWNIYKIQLF